MQKAEDRGHGSEKGGVGRQSFQTPPPQGIRGRQVTDYFSHPNPSLLRRQVIHTRPIMTFTEGSTVRAPPGLPNRHVQYFPPDHSNQFAKSAQSNKYMPYTYSDDQQEQDETNDENVLPKEAISPYAWGPTQSGPLWRRTHPESSYARSQQFDKGDHGTDARPMPATDASDRIYTQPETVPTSTATSNPISNGRATAAMDAADIWAGSAENNRKRDDLAHFVGSVVEEVVAEIHRQGQ